MSQPKNIDTAEIQNCLPETAIQDSSYPLVNAIIDNLILGRNVELPELGRLEVKKFPGRKTVLFIPDSKQQKSEDNSEINIFSQDILRKLQESEEVSFHALGTFKNQKRENKNKISFLPSIALRNLLNEKTESIEIIDEINSEIKESEDTIKINPDIFSKASDEKTTNLECTSNNENAEEKHQENNKILTTSKRDHLKPSKIGDTIIPWDEKSKENKHNIISRIVVGIFLIILTFVVVFIFFRKNSTTDDIQQNPSADNQYNLPELSLEHYGHTSFWVYIFDKNKEKLSSPLHIPSDVNLEFPDLKEEYDIDVTDSMEIRRANLRAETILKEYKYTEY